MCPSYWLGIYLIVGRFFADAVLRSRTYYGLTTERIVIVSGLFSRTTKSLQLRTLSDVSLSESNDGLGTITFGPAAPWWAGSGGWPGSRQQLSPSFESISAARDVYEKIRAAQNAGVVHRNPTIGSCDRGVSSPLSQGEGR